jgi:hypothetical protein
VERRGSGKTLVYTAVMRAAVHMFVILALAGAPVAAQTSLLTSDPERLAAEITKKREENQELMKRYSWKQHTEVKQEGKLIHQAIENVRLAPDGEIEKTPVAEAPTRKFKRQKKKRREWAVELRALLEAYALPTEAEIRDYLTRAKIGPADTPQTLRIRAQGVIQPGDELTMWVDSATKKIKRVKVMTHLDDETVMTDTDYARLDGGLVVKARQAFKVPDAKIVMVVESYDFVEQ